MSKLEELLQQLCPDGVEYKKLGEIATITRGGSLQKKDFIEDGYPCIHYGQIYTKYPLFPTKTFTFISSETAKKQRKALPNDIVMAVTSENVEDVCKCVAWMGDAEIAVSGHTAIIHHNQDPKFLTYYFYSKEFFEQKKKLAHGTKVIEVTPDRLGDITLPVPPLQVQREIVRILDNFTNLTAELTAELTARKKQYEFYLNKIFDIENNSEKTTIDKICKKICSGGTPTATRGDYYGGDIPWLRTQEVDWKDITDTELKITQQGYDNSSVKWIPANCIIVAMYGATAGKAAINKIPLTTNQACCNLEIDENKALYKYVYYWFCKEYLILKSLGQGSQNNINAQIVKNYEILLPTIEKQKYIVEKLDSFEKICSDMFSGLPAEIEARKKQYEYYRDKLLTFKRK